MSNTFKINDLSFRYRRDLFNNAYENERSVEVALGEYFLKQFCNVIEVGCVMPYYGHSDHTIYDLCDEHPNSVKANALDLNYTGENVVAISTIEHMHKKEYSNGSDLDGVNCMLKIINSARNYLITFPTQYNDGLTEHLKTHPEVPRLIMRRINWKNEYVKHEDCNDFSIPFGHSDRPIPEGWWNNSNGIVIVTNLRELL